MPAHCSRSASLLVVLLALSCHGSTPLDTVDAAPVGDSSVPPLDSLGVADGAAGGGSGGGGMAGGGMGGGGMGGGAYGGGCPSTAPAQGGSCPRAQLVCEYGDDPRTRCHTRAECTFSRTWNVIPPSCDPIPPASCPASREQASGQSCATVNAVCAYAGLACTCTNCVEYPVSFCNGPLLWKCDAPSADAGCPAAAGYLGTTCKPDGLACRYRCDLGRLCQGGIWVDSQVGSSCPVSLRSAKRDIRYLTDADRARLAAEVERIRLATYRYIDPTNGQGTRLGFIIDDSPGIAAVEADRGHVDLYAYASMAVAALQQQAREIAELRREIALLKRRRH
jgi:hypothetical protein